MNSTDTLHRPINVHGKHYNTLSSAARKHGLDTNKVLERVRCGWSIEEALELTRRLRPSGNYKSRKEAFAAQQGISPSSVESRLSVRRNRIREWLALPAHTPERHSNAITVTDTLNQTHTSQKQAAKSLGVHRYNVPKHAVKMEPIEKYPFEKEMEVSAETLMLLCTHPNLLNKPNLYHPQGHKLQLDNYVPLRLTFKEGRHGYYVDASIEYIDVFYLRVEKKPQLFPASLVFQPYADLSIEEQLARRALLEGCACTEWDAFEHALRAYCM